MPENKITRALLTTMERAKLFYSGLGFAGIATALLSGLIYWLNGDNHLPIRMLLIGAMLVGVVQLAICYLWYQRKPELTRVKAWVYYPLATALSAGICWGAITAYLLLHYSQIDTGLVMLLSAAANALLFILLLSALDLMVLSFSASFLIALLWVFYDSGTWPPENLITVLLAVVVGLGLIAAAFSVLFGIIARLRAGKQNVSGKLDLARHKMVGLHNRLTNEDERRRDVEQELYLAKEAAETANMVKSEFLATMSHEIRTPLNGIVPLLEMLRESKLDREQRQFVTTALNASYHLLSIINDILDFSKIEAGKLDLESIELNLNDLVESVVAMMAKSAERRGLELDYSIAADLPAVVRGDPIRLRQVLTNLVSNAIKFTSKGGVRVEVVSRTRSRKNIDVMFAIKDTGDGISDEVQARLFRSFNQADASTTRKHGGTGLGLVISRRLVELMGGKIGVRSQEGKGSVFWFVVPLRKSLGDMPAERQSLSGLRTLYVGERDKQLEQVGRYLDEWGMLYQYADGAMDALSKLVSTASLGESWAYELLIVDGKSLGGRMAGLLQGINGEPLLGGVKLLVIGPLSRSVNRLGIDAILDRPVKPRDLHRILCRLMDVQDEAGQSRQRGEERLANQFLYADIQEQSWAESVPIKGRDEDSSSAADAVQLMGHILLVEDNLVNLKVAKKMLLRLGLDCDEAQDGLAALRAINRHHYDLVLMDCQMPHMDGYEATKAIRLREVTKGLMRLPVIAMTANAMEGDREKCLDAGMDDYLSKPIMPATLRLMLSQWLPRRDQMSHEVSTGGVLKGEDTASHRQAPSNIEQTTHDIDATILAELYEIMEEDFVGLIGSFLDAAPSLIREIEAGILDGQPAQVVLPAHSLKSTSANVGALKLSALAAQMEKAARGGDLQSLSEAFESLGQTFEAAAKLLHRACEQGLD
ncbi:ATP-binding protein [Sedimenticola sp.]|uniref:ATP-binding protein n=1 Tax=Sedimenticola sp. TaxID=1940285 RepID=UPI003D116CA4